MIDQQRDISLWLLKAQYFLSGLFHSRLIASVFLLYVPVIASGYYLSLRYDQDFFSRGVHMALAWLALAPLLIQVAVEVVANFFDNHKGAFADEVEWRELRTRELRRLQAPSYMIFGIPWASLTTAIVVLMPFSDAALAIRIWAGVAFFLLFIVTSIGFYGVYVLVTMMRRIFQAKVVFNPYHPDKFGGISDFGRFTVKGALLFSTGSLIFPLAFEIAADAGEAADLLVIGLYFCMLVAVAVILAAFLLPIQEIQRFVGPTKDALILKSRRELDETLTRFRATEPMDMKLAVDVFARYYLEHKELNELKDYPFDLKVIMELVASLIIPVAIAALEFVL